MIFALIFCFLMLSAVRKSASVVTSESKNNAALPCAIIHIGPHKTGSTHLQLNLRRFVDRLEQEGYYYPKLNEDTGYDVKDAALFGHYLHGNGSGSERVMSTTAKMKEFLRQSAGKKRNIIISVENFSTLSGEQVKMLRDTLNAFDVTIVMAYREWLSRFRSHYAAICFHTESDVVPFSSAIFEEVHTHGFQIDSMVETFGRRFDWKLKILDYYGMAAAGKDLVHVVLCEIAGVLCDYTKQLNDPAVRHENPAKDWVPRGLLDVFRDYVQANDGCQLPRVGLREILKIFRANISCAGCHKPPTLLINASFLSPASRDYDSQFRQKYGAWMLYQNAAANYDAMQRVSGEELKYWSLYDDSYWRYWLWEQFNHMQQLGLVHCHHDNR